MNNKTYDILKYIAQIVLPGLGTLYFTVAALWGLPYADEIVGTVVALDTFLGILLKISSNNYDDPKKNFGYDGTITLSETADKQTLVFEPRGDVSSWLSKDEVRLKITPQ